MRHMYLRYLALAQKANESNSYIQFGAKKNGRKRENQAQNRPSAAVGKVRKFPHEPARTRGISR